MPNQDENKNEAVQPGALPDRAQKWLSSGAGGLVGAVGTLLVIVIPVVNTWLSNTKEIQLQQLKNSGEQIQYAVQRMHDTEKERDLYREEMTVAQRDLRTCQNELSKVGK